MTTAPSGFEQWIILEVYGHRRLAGKATEAPILGGGLLRLDIPNGNGGFITQYYGPGAIFSMTPTTEVIAREVAKSTEFEPVHRWELPQLMRPLDEDEREDT